MLGISLSQPSDEVVARRAAERVQTLQLVRKLRRLSMTGFAVVFACSWLVLSAGPASAGNPGFWGSDGTTTNGWDRSNWVSGLADDLPLSALTIPGTHDSGTYANNLGGKTSQACNLPDILSHVDGYCCGCPLGPSVKGVAQTQGMDIATQLKAGIRALDIRLGEIGGTSCGDTRTDLWVVHASTICYPLTFRQVMTIVTDFLRAHPRETVLMRITRDTPNPNDATFDQRLRGHLVPFREFLWDSHGSTRSQNPLLGEIRRKIVILQDWKSLSPPACNPPALEWPACGAREEDAFYGSLVGLRYREFQISDAYDMPAKRDLSAKWRIVKIALELANSSQVSNKRLTYLSAVSSNDVEQFRGFLDPPGPAPFFFAGGVYNAATNASQARTGWLRFECSDQPLCLNEYYFRDIQIYYKGINQLALEYISSAGFNRLGVVYADYPSPGNFSEPASNGWQHQGLIGYLIAVNDRFRAASQPTTLTLTADATCFPGARNTECTAIQGQKVRYTATLNPIPSGPCNPQLPYTCGYVSFYDTDWTYVVPRNDDPTVDCSIALIDRSTGRATCTATYAESGAHEITAHYWGSEPPEHLAESHSPLLNLTVSPLAVSTVGTAASPQPVGTDTGTCRARVDGIFGRAGRCEGFSSCTVNGAPSLLLPLGNHTINVVANGLSGQTATGTSYVNVYDKEDPKIICQPQIGPVECTQLGRALVAVNPFVTDNCPNPTTSTTCSGALQYFPLGSSEVTCTATDGAGRRAECQTSVTVEDTRPPFIDHVHDGGEFHPGCPEPIVRECTGPDGATATFSANALDDCEGEKLATCPDSGRTFALGAHTPQCSASDSAGHEVTCTVPVTVVDTTPPVITCDGDISVAPTSRDGAVVTFGATATDICDSAPNIVCPQSGQFFETGTTTTVECYATDASENDSSCSLTVHVSAFTCGNGALDAGEECDDGNTQDDDCCSRTCQLEASLDLDGDGRRDVATDVVYLARFLLRLSPVPPSFRSNDPAIPSDLEIGARAALARSKFDVDGDGTLSVATDVVYIARYLLGLSPVPPSFRAANAEIPSDAEIAQRIDHYCPRAVSGTSP